MSSAAETLRDAIRDYEIAIYRDLPATNHRYLKADRAVAQTLEVVFRTLGIPDGTTVTLRPGDAPLVVEP